MAASRSPASTTGAYRRSPPRSEEHTSELQSRRELVCRLLLEKKKPCDADSRRDSPRGSRSRRLHRRAFRRHRGPSLLRKPLEQPPALPRRHHQRSQDAGNETAAHRQGDLTVPGRQAAVTATTEDKRGTHRRSVGLARGGEFG